MSKLLLLLLCFQSGDLLDAVNSERGGRHWIDQKPAPPKSPSEQQKTFRLESGSRIELVAAEPLVFDPVWIDFDHHGRMFVAEYTDYPIGPVDENGEPIPDARPLSRIVLLTDEDNDGTMDRRTVFADGLDFCHSFLPLQDGILAAAQTELIFLKDTDGDHIADVREVWFDGFTPAHPQMQIGCPRWGMDNRIYLTYAPGNVRCRRPGFESQEPVRLPRQDMYFDPQTMEFGPVSGLGQFGQAIDNYGHRFFCTNRNPVMMEVIPQGAVDQYSWVPGGRKHADVGPSGGDTKVFPLVDMKSNWLSHAGTHTSACGVTAYRGHLWDSDFQRSVFACEPVGHLVTRSILQAQDTSPVLTTRPAEPDRDFLAATDTWFRPGSLRTGPDGALYLADMYRMWVEHPKFLPPEIAARIDWRAGEDRGRIWRIVPKDYAVAPAVQSSTGNDQTAADRLLAQLQNPNGWQRDSARQRIVERQIDVAAQIIEQLRTTTDELVRLSLLSTLDGLKSFDLQQQIRELDPATQQAIRTNSLYAQSLNLPTLFQPADHAVKLGTNDDSAALPADSLYFLLLHRGPESSIEHVATAALQFGNDPWFAALIPKVCRDRAGQALLQISSRLQHAQDEPDAVLKPVAPSLIEQLGRAAGVTGEQSVIRESLAALQQFHDVQPDAAIAVLTGLGQGLKSRRTAPNDLSQLLTQMQDVTGSVHLASTILRQADQAALDSTRTAAERVAALELALTSDSDAAGRILPTLLQTPQPVAVADVVARHCLQNNESPLIAAVLDNWNRLPPATQQLAVSIMLTRPAHTQRLLAAMQQNVITPAVIDIDQRVRLLQHRDAAIREHATKLLGGVVSANRKAVADEYSEAISLAGDVEKGASVFRQTCSKCHKINGVGTDVGPDISDTRNRSRDALLYDILDPNRRVDPQFSAYIVVTDDGRSFNGLLVAENDDQITLRQPEGREQVIARAEIEELQATRKSLMPEGIEKDVTVQQMADLLAFLKNRSPAGVTQTN